jgi:MFS transporter, PAT family, beta-lactamase induction signal transducer AmpG
VSPDARIVREPGGIEGAMPADRKTAPFWVLSTYFAEGFPYSLVRQVSTVFFKDAGASLETVGMTSLYGLPWTLKFLQAPLVDGHGHRKTWVVLLEALLALVVGGLAAGSRFAAGGLGVVPWFFLAAAFASATHDVAVDGYYLDSLDREAQARWVGFQAMAYRLALIAGGGGVVWLSGVTSWHVAFGAAAALLAAIALWHGRVLGHPVPARKPMSALGKLLLRWQTWAVPVALVAGLLVLRPVLASRALSPIRAFFGLIPVSSWIALALLVLLVVLLFCLEPIKRRLAASDALFARAFVDWLDQPRIAAILAFLVLYRLGESFLLAMVYPMLSDCGVSRAQYGVMYGTFGIVASITGGILGGWLIGRFGLRRVVWPLVLAQNVPNLLYGLAASIWGGVASGTVLPMSSLAALTSFVVLEALGAGLGTSVFMVFVMRTTRPGFRATHMALATGIMNVAGVVAGVGSGGLAHQLGFPLFFTFTFLATLPGMALIPFLPHLDNPGRA